MAISRVTKLFLTGWRMVRGEDFNNNLVTPLNTTIDAVNSMAAGTYARAASDGITAAAGGGQTNATQLAGTAANVTVVATAADSVKLPAGFAGAQFCLQNSDASDAVQVFGNGTDTINGVATATGVSQAAGKSAIYFCATNQPAAKWFRSLSA